MTPYNSSSVCPKCGCGSIGTQYDLLGGTESLVRTCFRCSYRWHEEPLDAERKSHWTSLEALLTERLLSR